MKSVGEWRRGKAEGRALGIYRNGYRDAGEWKNSNNDEWGRQPIRNGNVNAGQSKAKQNHGKDLCLSANGAVHKGTEWECGKGS